MCKKITFLLLFSCLLGFAKVIPPAILYVDASRHDNSGNGLSWAAAKKDIQNAIDLAGAGSQVWVKAGVYYPNASPDMTASTTVTTTSPLTSRDYYIKLKDGVSIFGGFAGIETAISQRNISNNPTYIDGDIGVPGDKTDNCYHLMIYVGTYSTTGVTVDGLVLRNGNATRLPASTNPSEETYIFANGFDNPISRRIGGGLYVGRGLNNTISNIVFENNECEVFGAALYLYGISGVFCTYNVFNCYFVNNRLSASSYGAMCSDGGVVNCYNSVFYNNSCGSNGGDGVALNLIRTKNKLVNCTFANNQSYTGSALSIQSSETTEIYNCIFNGNTRSNTSFAATSGYDFRQFFTGPKPMIKNCSLMHPSANYTAANYTEMDATSSGNLYEQAQSFSDINNLKGADGKYFTADDGLALKASSTLKNAGLNSLLPAILTVDITYASRILATNVDMGAYEVDGVLSLSDTILAQIGNEGDSPNTVPSAVTITQLGQIVPAITGIVAANQSAYQTYIDANPNLFSAPATAAEVQAMVNEINSNVAPTFTQVESICSGITLAALPTTSNNGFAGSWSPALNNSLTTLYTFTPNVGQSATTATMTITVNPNVVPTFTAVAPICSGATLAALPTTSNNGITGNWSPALNNLATTTYTFTPDAGQCATIASTTITVNASGTISGGNVTVCAVGTALNLSGVSTAFANSTTLTLNGATTGSIIEWQRSINYNSATPSWLGAVNTSTTNNNVVINGNILTVSNLSTIIWYRAKVKNGTCVTYADPVKITVSPVARAGAVTGAASVCYGGDITFTSAAIVGSSISWEVSTTSAISGFTTVTGANGLTFTMSNIIYASLSKFYVRSVVTSGDCSIARSSVRTVTVNPSVAIAGTVTGAGTFCASSNATLRISNYTGTIQWVYSTDGNTFNEVPYNSTTLGYQNPTGATTFTTTSLNGRAGSYAVKNITGTTYFKAIVKSGTCSTVESNVVEFNTATSATAPSLSVESASICSGNAAKIYLPLNIGNVRFQKSNNWSSSTPTWTNVNLPMTQTLNNSTTGEFSTGVLSTSTAYRVSASIGTCAPIIYSDIVVIGVVDCNANRAIETALEINTPFDVMAYPNPSKNVFNFKINGANDDVISILVFDMMGKQIENKVVNANEIENISLGQNYSSGIYNVIVSQGFETKTLRVIKK